LFSGLFPFVDQRHDYFASRSHAWNVVVSLLAGAMGLVARVPIQ
jgi:hypothetical protein